MNKFTKAIAAIMLIVTAIIIAGCNKPDEPNNCGNNGNNDGDVRVTTYTPQEITATTAKCGGDVIVTEGLSLIEIGVCWSMEQNPTVDQTHLSTTGWDEPFVCTILDLKPDTKYYVRAYALRGLQYYYGDVMSFTTESDDGGNSHIGPATIDLGLPSGILWASCNLGADTPEGYGDYFAWGETRSKEVYDWNTYKYGYYDDNYSFHLTKYNTDSYYGPVDNTTTLQPCDDAITSNYWGTGWRMPTEHDWRELYQNTTTTWIIQNGIKGRLFTASNGQSIFLPAAGYRYVDDFKYEGSRGYYWSSDLYNASPRGAWSFYYDSDSYYIMGGHGRLFGCSVRAVRSVQ